jgi:hypothetical protein
MKLTTKRGYDLFEVASCLQKAIRRGDTALAGYMAIELFESGYHNYCWKRLMTISAEDCAGIITQEVKALHDSFVLLNQGAKKVRSRIFISKAVIVLCQARKCRDADHLQNFVYDREMLDAKALTEAIVEAHNNPEKLELPEYTFDVHTHKGRVSPPRSEMGVKTLVGVRPAASLYAVVKACCAWAAAASAIWIVPLTVGDPVTEAPGLSPRSPLIVVVGMLVTVEAARTANVLADPRATGARPPDVPPAVVKLQLKSPASAVPARSLAPVVTVAV